MALSTAQCADLLEVTLSKFERLKYTDIALDTQEYVAMPELLKKRNVRFDGGSAHEWKVRVALSGAAHTTGLYAVDDLEHADVFRKANIPWRHVTTNWQIDRREINMNRGAAERIVNLVQEGENDAMTDLAKLLEGHFWGKPADSSDEFTPYGVKYWVKKHITGTSASNTDGIPGGFNGGNPTGFTSGAGGLSSTTWTNWANWTFKYVNTNRSDMVRSWRKASHFCMFKPPVPTPTINLGNMYGYYVRYSVMSALEEILENQNDNLGNDVASKDGVVMFRRTPVTWVPFLEADTDNPIYGINWGKFQPVFLSGEYMVRGKPKVAPNQHTVIVTHVDCTLNFRCVDRRSLFVGSTAASYQN